MRKIKQALTSSCGLFISVAAVLLLSGCQSSDQAPPAPQPPAAAAPAASAPAPAVAAASTTAAAPKPGGAFKPQSIIRIKAGVAEPFTDGEGNVWLPEQGFQDGETTDRPDLKIENTKIPTLYLTERYSMTSFTYPVPNGKYLVKLHFAETYEGITGPGQRVFSFNVQGHEFKDLDIWAKAGGPLRPYIESVPVTVTDGKVHITFTPNVENPQINGIEIIPQP